MDASQAGSGDGELVSFEYRPRHWSPDGLMEAMQSFMSSVVNVTGPTSRNVNNITLARAGGVILVRDQADRAAKIREALERLDQPSPQLMLSCQVVRGVAEVHGQAASRALADSLRPLLPYDAYQVEAVGMLRASAAAGTRIQIQMSTDAEESMPPIDFQLQMRVGAYDQESGALGLEQCQLVMNHPQRGSQELFSTATTIYRGEMAVLGVTGADPLFLVVQVHPVRSTN